MSWEIAILLHLLIMALAININDLLNKQKIESNRIEFKMLLGQKIKELRLENGVLQRQLASFLNIDTPMFSKIERGDRRAKRIQVIQIQMISTLAKINFSLSRLQIKSSMQWGDEEELKSDAIKIA